MGLLMSGIFGEEKRGADLDYLSLDNGEHVPVQSRRDWHAKPSPADRMHRRG
ncbi:hypothetical protein DACRYDRAFT_89348 [Dacryopinax primogenitus]|uniref:Uncharacterized protein n=1 Tax=Dacryopinax primogenitus (strain DJM 731) TaxID=1858805 RepID=M5G4T6_DACPD|nr:uncharacterized protein DACRYDRAFT_89348 [Dacryopinax primogenitus]EJU00872.1 hypothetical protein DACRYDRAFT_89348 [Dacryopinax primogenitus]